LFIKVFIIMNIDENVLRAMEKLFNKILLNIYPMINNIDIEKPILDGDNKYIINIYTSIPETINEKNYWDFSNWYDKNGKDNTFDYHYMNDVIISKLLKYFSLNDINFKRELRIYNVNGDLIISTN